MNKAKIIAKLRESVARGKLPTGLKITCRTGGGMPSERVEEELTIHGGQANVRSRNMLTTAVPQESGGSVESEELAELVGEMAEGLESLVTRAEARFLPDSPIGTITVEVDGESEELYYLDDDEPEVAEGPSAPKMKRAILRLRTMSKRIKGGSA